MNKVLIKFGEISLKGKNRNVFINKLVSNLQKSANRQKATILSMKKTRDRVVVNFEDDKEKIHKVLGFVLGIKYYSFIDEVETDFEKIKKNILGIYSKLDKKIETIGFKTKRSYKEFPMISPEINKQLGFAAKKIGFKTDFKKPTVKIFIEITKEKTYIYSEKFLGESGLPVGTSGKVLVLLSGGIDSPVAAYKMMLRGCTCDFLHFHTNPLDNKAALKTKMPKIVEKINDYQFKSKLFLVPRRFYKIMTHEKIKPRYELVFFKHYIFKVADEIAKKYKYDAIVSGNALAQVASQTIENIRAVEHDIETLVFTPLLTYEKEEIMQVAREIGTYEIAIEEYADCCSLVSKNPMTQTKLIKFKEVLEKFGAMDELLEKSMDEVDEFEIK